MVLFFPVGVINSIFLPPVCQAKQENTLNFLSLIAVSVLTDFVEIMWIFLVFLMKIWGFFPPLGIYLF